MLHQWVNKSYVSDTQHFRNLFMAGKPFSHLALPDFFLPAKANALSHALNQEKWRAKDSDLFCFHQTPDLSSSSNRVIPTFYSFFSSPAFRHYISTITATKPLRSIDAAGFIYTDGDYLLPHDDRLEGRKIAYVINLTKSFTANDGGQLDFFEVNPRTGYPTKIVKSFTPRFNTLFLF